MMNCIQELIGLRIKHTRPNYGSGTIAKAYVKPFLNAETADIYIEIIFDNHRAAKPFSLLKCLSKGLINLETDMQLGDFEKLRNKAVSECSFAENDCFQKIIADQVVKKNTRPKVSTSTVSQIGRYNSRCWHCHHSIDSLFNDKCDICGWYICPSCGSCSGRH